MSALGKHAAANACGTCRKAVKAGDTVMHEECAARAVLLSAPDYPDYEDLLDLTDDERLALPARFHTPQFDSLGRPNMWQCRVCWGDGWVTQWPCKAAQENGAQVFTHAFVDDSTNELAALRARVAELENYERLSPQQCPKGLHADWLVDSEYAHDCPWCRIDDLGAAHSNATNQIASLESDLGDAQARVAELEGAAICPSIARLHGSKCVLPVRHRGDHGNESKRHYWSDDYAVPRQRQPEDPHDSVLHHDYALGRDLPAIPRQTTGRCPKGHTFEDCTCGGAA